MPLEMFRREPESRGVVEMERLLVEVGEQTGVG